MIEIWKDIKGYEGLYQVSNLSRIKSLSRKQKNRYTYFFTKEMIVNPHLSYQGYLMFDLRRDNKRKCVYLHRIVALHFIPVVENKPTINHKNGIKTDNRIQNLEWCTQKENVHHACKNNLMNPVKGSNHYRTSLKEEDVIKIREESKDHSQKYLSIKYKVSRDTIKFILSRRTWKHI
jgi:hypothetical protein